YAVVARRLLSKGASQAGLLAGVEAERPRIERWMSLLSTIITAAPTLGILGTVIGIITSFRLIGNREALTDPMQASAGSAEGLITTAAGLVGALVMLCPYMAVRGQGERMLSRLETLLAAADSGWFGSSRTDGAERTSAESVQEAGDGAIAAASSRGR